MKRKTVKRYIIFERPKGSKCWTQAGNKFGHIIYPRCSMKSARAEVLTLAAFVPVDHRGVPYVRIIRSVELPA